MKKISILFLTLPLFVDSQAFPFKKALLIATSMAAAYPMLKHAYRWSVNKKNSEALISSLKDIDLDIEKFVRQRLEDQGYTFAQNLPIKAYESDCTMEAPLDSCLGFSKHYEAQIKELLDKKRKGSLNEEDEIKLGSFISNLDHEMYHILHQHAKQSITMEFIIPFVTEIVTLPLITKVSDKGKIFFISSILVSIFLKRAINKHLEILHRKSQEMNAEKWAIEKNDDIDSLNIFIKWRERIVLNAIIQLSVERAEFGKSRSIIFNGLAKIFADSNLDFDVQRYDTDNDYAIQCFQSIHTFYEKLYQQPQQWPLRLLAYAFDPVHPFALDLAKMAQNHINRLGSTEPNEP